MAMKDKEKTSKPGVYRLTGGGWMIEATQRDATRRRVYRRMVLSAELSLAEAARERAALVLSLADELARGAAATVTPRTITLSDFAEHWLVRKAARLKPSVRALYVDVIGRRVLPVLGGLRIDAVSRGDVVRWVAWAERQRKRNGRSYAQATLRQWWRVLGTLLKDAAAEAEVADPTNRVTSPSSPERAVREKVTLIGGQIRDLLVVVEREYPGWYAEIFVLAFSGVRPGELYALQWGDVDQAAGVIHVQRSVWRGQVGRTKTDDPRDIALTDPIREVLKAHRQRLLREQHPGLEAGLMFPAATGGHRGPEALRNTLLKAAKKAGIASRVTAQVLRRTLNTLMVEAGIPEVVIRSQMGHTTTEMTNRYAGVHPEAKQEAVARLHALVERGGEG